MLDGLLQDVRYALRTLARSPGFTAVAVGSLALGIGVNIAVFGFANSAILKPLPVDRPDRLVSIYHRADRSAGEFNSSSYPEYEFYRDHNSVFSGMLAYLRVPMIAGSASAAQRISGELVSPEYFDVLGIRPAAGRFFENGETGAVAVIADGLWHERFGRDPSAVGRALRIGAGTFTIVGVAPREFRGVVMDWADPPSVWVPVARYAEAVPAFSFDVVRAWGMESYLVTARLRPGVTAEQAGAQLVALTARLREMQNRRQGQTAVALPVQQARFWPAYRGGVLTLLGTLMAIVGAILLIACANLANLLLARFANRRREMAMRLALGAGRGRIARQMLVETLLLAALGGAAAMVVGAAASGFLSKFHRAFRIPLALDSGWDWRVAAFAVGASLLTGLLFGAAPVLETWRAGLNDALRSGTAGAGLARSRLRSAMLVGQVALSTVLLAGAGLFVRTLHNARAEGPSAEPAHLLLARLEPSADGFPEEHGRVLYVGALARIRALPGVKSAALTNIVPFGGTRGGTDIVAPDGGVRQVDVNVVSPGYFETASVPLVRGRDFTDRDIAESAAVAVVNERFAARFWPGEDPLGKTFRQTRPPRAVTVVGVTRDGKVRGYRDTLRPGFYVPLAQQYRGEMTLEVRSATNAALLAGAVRRAICAVDAAIPVPDVATMEARLDDALSQERLVAAFASGLGALALALGALGIYGVLSFSVTRRRREIGVRMALGARPAEVAGMVVRQSAVLTGGGLAIGAVAAALLARTAESLLYGVKPLDPVAFGAALALLAAVALAAALVPAWRAARVDPASTLRGE
jgi:predicted permease